MVVDQEKILNKVNEKDKNKKQKVKELKRKIILNVQIMNYTLPIDTTTGCMSIHTLTIKC